MTTGFSFRKVAWMGLGIVLALSATTAAAGTRQGYSGEAYGSYAYVASEQGFVRVGKSAMSALGCVTTTGFHADNTVATVSVPPLFSAGQVNSRSDSLALTTGSAARTSAEVHNLDLLNGLITAEAVKAVSSSTQGPAGFSVSASGSNWVNLNVLGVLIAEATPNTRIELPGLGYVILDEQIPEVTPSSAKLTVNMIHVVITETNALGIPWGTHIIVSHADSGTLYLAGTLGGVAYGTQVMGSVVRMGASALAYMPCLGTDGQVRFTDVGSVNLQNVFTTESVISTAKGTVTPDLSAAEMTATIKTVNVLNGLITVDLVRADAHSAIDGVSSSVGDDGSTFLTLRVAGHPEITENIGPD